MRKRYFKTSALFSLFCSLLLATSVSAQGNGRDKVLEGNELFGEGKLDAANNAYRDAQLSNPASPMIDYNIANTLYEKKNYEEALKLYDKALKGADDAMFQSEIYYNKGNSLFRLNKLPESILAYKDALKLNPDDEDAKYNLEFVRSKLKENADPQEQDPNQEQKEKKIEPSEYAKKLKAQAEAFVARREYKRANDLMQAGLKVDETVAAFQDFISRIQNIVEIETGEVSQ